ncbi:divalent-cation tolerance protein CutA [Crossiella sp. CA198]|uniref:divalent-cation tolerance protein CutA n=1 Tax=Crossiella sp. CA198 TaxID=3455607 RepID=UPI003F8CFC52
MAEHLIVTTTLDTPGAAHALAAAVVEARLAACVQILPVTSVYRWHGAIQSDPEWRLECKTSADRLDALLAELRARHSYEEPELIATPIVAGSPGYLDWVIAETR